jgi:tetraprenyl-beta-curcumene synthase
VSGLPSSSAAARSSPRRARAGGALRALALANARYWPTVAPQVREELKRWQASAQSIPDQSLRELANAKLDGERFNAEVAATLATLAPREGRARTTAAIVALELLFDYLDGRTERPSDDPIASSLALFGYFTAAVDTDAREQARQPLGSAPRDSAYLHALSAQTRQSLIELPAAAAVASAARVAAERCAIAQSRLHAAAALGDDQLRDWAIAGAHASGLEWRAYVGGATSSVLSLHALIAAAANPTTSVADAERLDAAYLAIGAVITTLDSLVDHTRDAAGGELGYIRLYETPQVLADHLQAVTREALARAREAPQADHHTMTLAGIVAYYTSHPGAADPHARTLAGTIRRELAPTIWPTLAVMRCWRAAKRARRLLPRPRGR